MANGREHADGQADPGVGALLFADLAPTASREPSAGAVLDAEALLRGLPAVSASREVESGGCTILLFERPIDAVCAALAWQRTLRDSSSDDDSPFRGRVGIVLGAVRHRRRSDEQVERGARPLALDPDVRETGRWLLALALPGQTLTTRPAAGVGAGCRRPP